MNRGRRQRGSILLIAIAMIVAVSALAVAFTSLYVGDASSSADHAGSSQALFVAESGLERALRGMSTGTACAGLVYANVAIGNGTFTTGGTLYQPGGTALSGAINATATTIPVGSTAGFAPHGRISVNGEQMYYAALSGGSFTGVRRGAGGTAAQAHAGGSAVSQNQCLIRSTGTVAAATRVLERAVGSGSGGNGALMVYAKNNGNGRPYYRLWDGAAWGAEQQANAVPANLHFMVLKSSRTRNEVLLATQSSTGDINVQVWNGSSWSAPVLLGNTNANGGNNANYRGFDIEYETNGDRALIVYNNDTRNPQVRIWNGTVWSGPAGVHTSLGLTSYPSQNSGTRPRWIELAPNPLAGSNEIMLITLDSRTDVYGARWTGLGWNNMGTNTRWDTDAATSTRKAIDVAYEQLSGRAMFIWGDSTVRTQRYQIWNGAARTEPLGGTALVIAAMGDGTAGRAQWVRLVPQPQSNNLMYGVVDHRSDLNTRFWNGAGWDAAHPEHDASVEDANDRNFDIVFETFPANLGRAWLVWGDGSRVARRAWNGGAWGGTTTTGDDTALVQLYAHPVSGAVLAAIYEDSSSATDDIRAMQLTGGGAVWSGLTQVWSGATVGNPVRERVALSAGAGGITLFDWVEVIQ